MRTLLADNVDIRSNLQTVEGGNKIVTDFGQIVGSLLGVAILIGALAAFGYLILGAIQWITSGGDKGKVESARNKILNAIIGLALVAASYAFFAVIQYFFGIDILAEF